MVDKLAMQKTTTLKSYLGQIDVFVNANKTTLYVIPQGYVGPSLVKKDLNFALEFENSISQEWTYIVDTSKVSAVSPLNPLFLNLGLKRFKRMKAYVVYAPSPIVRMMLSLTNWINKPDKILKSVSDLQLALEN